MKYLANLRKSIMNLILLYFSKLGTIIVGILILPQFSNLLGAQNFEIVAVIFSLQSLLVMLDFGMSTLVGRDVAAFDQTNSTGWNSWRTSDFAITGVYILIAPAVWLLNFIFDKPVTNLQLAGCLLIFWSQTLQNVAQTVLIAAYRIGTASVIQLFAVLIRAVITVYALQAIHASLDVFIATQAMCMVAQWLLTSAACRRLFPKWRASRHSLRVWIVRSFDLLRRGAPLALVSAAGAAVMQLDKPIVSAFTTAMQTVPYYLATVLCLTPLSSLAGPVAQFYQPRIIRSLSSGDNDGTEKNLTTFAVVLALVTLVPSSLLWLKREEIIGLWLGSVSYASQVVELTEILLPGAAIGALGYLPYTILIARQEYRFQAIASTCIASATLAGAAFFAYRGSIENVCWVYTGYHCGSTLVSWLRCIWLERGYYNHAKLSLFYVIAIVLIIFLMILILIKYT